ncbi:MAG: competence/damage-inducible protein A [Bacteroidota bacterium]
MRAEVLSIGTELLIGQVVNTNATFLAQQLASLGIDLLWVTTIGDNPDRLLEALRAAWKRADLVICTGGLGPTQDDITTEGIAQLIWEPLQLREDVLAYIEGIFHRRGRKMTEMDKKQAFFPPSAKLIPNPPGTAYGFYVERDEKLLMAFPGVPSELEVLWRQWAGPTLRERSQEAIVSRLLKFVGMSEASVATAVADLIKESNPTVAPYAGKGEVHLRVTAKDQTQAAAEARLEPVIGTILERLGEHCFATDGESLPGAIGQLLAERGETLATAESCTGGLIASRLTDVPGSSRYFQAGFIPYATEQNTALLGIPADFIEKHGVVSREVAEALAKAAREKAGTDWGLGITGYASLSGDAPSDRVGTVFVGISGETTEVRELRLGGMDRESI